MTRHRTPNKKSGLRFQRLPDDFVSSTVQRLARGREKFAPDAGVGGVGERPFGVGGKLNGHAPVGDGADRRIALFALRSGVGLLAAGVRRRRGAGGQQGLQVGNLGGCDAGQGVGAKLPAEQSLEPR